MCSAGVMRDKPNPQCPAPRGTPLLSCPGGQRGSSRPQQPPKLTPGVAGNCNSRPDSILITGLDPLAEALPWPSRHNGIHRVSGSEVGVPSPTEKMQQASGERNSAATQAGEVQWSSGSCSSGSKSRIQPRRHWHRAAASQTACLEGWGPESSLVPATARCLGSEAVPVYWS